MLTRPQFSALLRSRRSHSTLDAIGRELGVSRQAVYAWLKGSAVPSDTVLLLAELVWSGAVSGAVDVGAGLPIGGESAEDSRGFSGAPGWPRPTGKSEENAQRVSCPVRVRREG